MYDEHAVNYCANVVLTAIPTWLQTQEPHPRRAGSVAVSSRLGAVVEVNHAVAETAFVQ